MGGVVFGMMMGFMGTLPMIGKMVGYPNAVVGFLVHLAISPGIGGSFGLLMGHAIFGLVLGLAYSQGENCFFLKLGRTRTRTAPDKPNLRSVS